MTKKIALIAGVGGICGSNMARLLADTGEWDIVGLSRSTPELGPWLRHIPVDLLDATQTRERLTPDRETGIGGVTHLFYTALLPGRTPEEESALNTRMLVNLMDTVTSATPELEHVHVLEGAKWYGHHLGPYKTPAREDDPSGRPAYFYEHQHDYVLKCRQGRSWTWSTTRPGSVCGFAGKAHFNLMTVLAVYASVLKAMDLPLFFPGDEATWNALTFLTDVSLLNRMMLWAATDPAAANQAYNCGNGDIFRWRDMWPRIAGMFDMEPAGVRTTDLVEFMADKETLWEDLTIRHRLRVNDFHRLAPWRYGDIVFRRSWDTFLSTVKGNRYGFTEMMDTEDMMRRIFKEFRDDRIIP
jgi:nucleoside-diphosphate-sugar epimerase